ncbi:hypothetical protein L6654_39570 [Bradyrhizobium sp. WYCCWR 13023]|uniref:PEP-CTERM protein-sorting domain-containing protein n=1 Tax=Bradyrhizobium zhengyangense TaxID=2911009 RepID=A0A9X1RJU6_9BRAD|nr:hypothetical protein [Bradyrhizobium zhengyangense]MCG2632703.1 hypothetical protein [Bradyrhizobium zhengyangense]
MGRNVWAGWLASVLLLMVAPAHAGLLKYELTGVDNLSFVLDTSRPIDGVSAEDAGVFHAFYFTNIQNTSAHNPFPYLTFYDSAFGGGLSAGIGPDDGSSNYFDLVSVPSFSPLFNGSVSSPSLITGTFHFADLTFALANPDVPVDQLPVIDTLKVTNITSAVPETGTWVMMIFGFAALGCMTTFRRSAQESAVL